MVIALRESVVLRSLPTVQSKANLRSSIVGGDVTPASLLSIGELSRRTGMSVSAIRFYETRGLVKAVRTKGNQRRFLRSDIRRLSFALIAQRLGLTLAEIEAELATLPQGRAPTRQDWQAISERIRGGLQARIEMLQKTRDLLDSCIGCGCLSLDRCGLYNPNDRAARAGAGPRFLLGDRVQDFDDADRRQVRHSTAPASGGRLPRQPGPMRRLRSRHNRRGGQG
jgi:MerR family transcriptional regulator, redox-sensitive transcriptional activator SoxR